MSITLELINLVQGTEVHVASTMQRGSLNKQASHSNFNSLSRPYSDGFVLSLYITRASYPRAHRAIIQSPFTLQ